MADAVQRRYVQHLAPQCGRDLRVFLEAPSTAPEATQCVSPRSPPPIGARQYLSTFVCPNPCAPYHRGLSPSGAFSGSDRSSRPSCALAHLGTAPVVRFNSRCHRTHDRSQKGRSSKAPPPPSRPEALHRAPRSLRCLS